MRKYMNQIFIAIDMHECELSYYIKIYGSVQQIHVFLNHFLFLYNKKLQTLFLKSVAYLFLFSIFSYIPSKSHTAKSLPSISLLLPSWLCPRPISNSQLHALLHFHLCPIYLVVFKGSYNFRWDISS